MDILERFESVAQNYVRTPRIVFDQAQGAELLDEAGNRYVDFFAGGGSLSYGHNNRAVRSALIDYLSSSRVLQTGNRTSVAKRQFVELFVTAILDPRKLNYRIMFTDPAGGVATETALRLARQHKNRANVVAFTNGSHGLTEGALAVTSKHQSRHPFSGSKANTVFMPFCGYFGSETDTIAYFRRYLRDSASGLDLPAAAIVETTQVHGGVHVASPEWLKSLAQLCREYDILLIVDETHTGCGRVGPYFSFEPAGIIPDIVITSNAMAAGLPWSMLLLKPELDMWRPGELVGAFQGDSLAFVAATELLSQWNYTSRAEMARNAGLLADELSQWVKFSERKFSVRGHGMIWALDFQRPGSASVISAWAFERGLVVEAARLCDEVVLVMPPLNIEDTILLKGLKRLRQVVSTFLSYPSGAGNFTQNASIGHKS